MKKNRLLMNDFNKVSSMVKSEWKSYITACSECAAICYHCVHSCTKDEQVQIMGRCIELASECAVFCHTAASLMSLESSKAVSACKSCAAACIACAEECSKYEAQYSRECARVCKACAQLCIEMVKLSTGESV